MLLRTHVGTQEFLKFYYHTLHGRKMNPLGFMFSHFIGCMYILFLDMIANIFLVSINTPSTKYTVLIGICSKYGDWMKFAIMESEIFVVITLLQMLVPISLFDSQEHLLIVLVHEMK
jgi:hypothetical protein